MNTNLKQTKNNSDCQFYNFSLFVPYPSNFMVVLDVLVSFFPMVYTPPTHKYFFVVVKIFFVSWSQGLGKFQVSWGPSVLGDLISILGDGGRRARCFLFHKGINDQSCTQLIAKLSVLCVYATFSHFYLGIFCLKFFFLFKCPLKLSKKCLLQLGNNSGKK